MKRIVLAVSGFVVVVGVLAVAGRSPALARGTAGSCQITVHVSNTRVKSCSAESLTIQSCSDGYLTIPALSLGGTVVLPGGSDEIPLLVPNACGPCSAAKLALIYKCADTGNNKYTTTASPVKLVAEQTVTMPAMH